MVLRKTAVKEVAGGPFPLNTKVRIVSAYERTPRNRHWIRKNRKPKNFGNVPPITYSKKDCMFRPKNDFAIAKNYALFENFFTCFRLLERLNVNKIRKKKGTQVAFK